MLGLIKIYISLFLLFFSSPIFSYEWEHQYLNYVFEGCIMGANDGNQFEYCGCYTHGISKNFDVLEVVELVDSGELLSNKIFQSIVDECIGKIDY